MLRVKIGLDGVMLSIANLGHVTLAQTLLQRPPVESLTIHTILTWALAPECKQVVPLLIPP